MSPYILRRDHYECQECRKKTGKIRRATLVHHIIPYEERPDLGLDEDNLEAVCDRCHNIIHGRVGGLMKQKEKNLLQMRNGDDRLPPVKSLRI